MQQQQLELQQQQQQQQLQIINQSLQSNVTPVLGLDVSSTSVAPQAAIPGNASVKVTVSTSSGTASKPGVPSATTPSVPTKRPPRVTKTAAGTKSPTKESTVKVKSGSKLTKTAVKLDHLDLSGKSKGKEEDDKATKQREAKKEKSTKERAAERDANKRSTRTSRNYRKTSTDEKDQKSRSESSTPRLRSSSESPSHSDSQSRSRSRSRSPRTGSSSPRSSERRERERRTGKSVGRRKDSKENKPDVKLEKRKSPSPDRAGEEKPALRKYSKQDQLPPKKRARLIEKEQQEAEKERESRAYGSRSERERAAGWVRSSPREHTGHRPPYRRPSLLDPNIKIPQELSLNKLATILEQAEKQLHSGALTHEQHQQLLRELNEIYNIQQQKRAEEKLKRELEKYGRRSPPPYHPKGNWAPHDEPRDPRDPRMMRDAYDRDPRDPRALRDPRNFIDPRDSRNPRIPYDARDPPIQDVSRRPLHPEDAMDNDSRHDLRRMVPQGDPRDPRQRSLLEDPRMRKLSTQRDARERAPLLPDPLPPADPHIKDMGGDVQRKEEGRPGMDVDERTLGYRQYRGPLDENLPFPPRDTDERDLQQFAKQGDTDLRKVLPGDDVSTKMDVDYRVLPAAFQNDPKENIQGIADTDERLQLMTEDSDERKLSKTVVEEKPVENEGKVNEEKEDEQAVPIRKEDIEKEIKSHVKSVIKKGAKAEWEAAAKNVKIEQDVDMRELGDQDEKETSESTNAMEKQDGPVGEEKSSEPSKSSDSLEDKDEREKTEAEQSMDADPKPDQVQIKSEDVDLPSDDVDFRRPMPARDEHEEEERMHREPLTDQAPGIQPLLDDEFYRREERMMDDDFRRGPPFGPGPPHFRRPGPHNQWRTWKKDHPDEVCSTDLENEMEGFNPRDIRHPGNMRRHGDPSMLFERDGPPMDPRQRDFRHMPPMGPGMHPPMGPPMGPPVFEEGDMPPLGRRMGPPDFEERDMPPDFEEGDMPPMGPPFHRERGKSIDENPEGFRDFREDGEPPVLERHEFHDRPPVHERDFLPDMDPRNPRFKDAGERRNGPAHRMGNLDEMPPEIVPADTPQSPEPEEILPPMYVVRPRNERQMDRPEQGPPPIEMRGPRPPMPHQDGPPFNGPRPEGMPPNESGRFQPRDGPLFRGPRPEGFTPRIPDNRDAPRGPMMPGHRGPRFMGPRGPDGMPRFPGDQPRPMGPGRRPPPDEPGMARMQRPPSPDGPMRGPPSSQFGPSGSSAMQRLPRNGPASNLPSHILSNVGNLQQIVKTVSQQVLQNLQQQMNPQNSFQQQQQQQQQRQRLPAQNLIRTALEKMGVQGNVPSEVMQAAQQNLIEQMKSMPNMNINMLRMMRPQQPQFPNKGGVERPPQPQGPMQQQRPPFEQRGPPGMQQRHPFPPGGMPPNNMPPNSMAQGMPQGFPPGMQQRGPGGPGPQPPSQEMMGLPNIGMQPLQGMQQPGMMQSGHPRQDLPLGVPRMPQGMPPGMNMQQQGGPPQRMMTPMGPGFFQPGAPPMGMPRAPQPQPQAPPAAGLSSQFDINSLFSKLLSSGIIKEPLKPSSPHPEQTSTPPPTADKTKEGEAKAADKEEDKDSQDIEDDGVYDIPEISLNSDELKTRYPGVIKRMYSGMQCTSCGMRFVIAQMDRYRKHLDWHFRQNRKKQDGIKATTSRKWFYEVDEWLEYEEINDTEDAKSTFFEEQAQEFAARAEGNYSVPVTSDSNDEFCKICRENFEQFFDEETEEWHLRDAIRVDGRTFHPSCYDDVKDTSGFLETTPTDELVSPPFVRTRNISFSGVPVSPGASSSSTKPPFIVPGKASWEDVKETNDKTEGQASDSGATGIKSEPGTVIPIKTEADVDGGTKEGSAVNVKVEPEEAMDTSEVTRSDSSSKQVQVKSEPSESADVVKVKEEPNEGSCEAVVKMEPVDSGESQTLMEKEQMRQEEMRSAMDTSRAKSSPLPFLEEVSPESPEEMDTTSGPSDMAPTSSIEADATTGEGNTKALASSVEAEPSVRPPSNENSQAVGVESSEASVTTSEHGIAAAAAAAAPPSVKEKETEAIKKPPLREAVATLRDSTEAAEPPVLEAEEPQPSASSPGEGQSSTQSGSCSIFEKLTPPPALASVESENSESVKAAEKAPGDDANSGSADTQGNKAE